MKSLERRGDHPTGRRGLGRCVDIDGVAALPNGTSHRGVQTRRVQADGSYGAVVSTRLTGCPRPVVASKFTPTGRVTCVFCGGPYNLVATHHPAVEPTAKMGTALTVRAARGPRNRM
jgi:hypothetical protein